MRRKDSQSISNILESILEENPQMADRLAENRLLQSWHRLLGVAVSRYTANLYIKNRCLYVKLTSAVVKNELFYCREKLIRNLNESVDRKVIDNIVFI